MTWRRWRRKNIKEKSREGSLNLRWIPSIPELIRPLFLAFKELMSDWSEISIIIRNMCCLGTPVWGRNLPSLSPHPNSLESSIPTCQKCLVGMKSVKWTPRLPAKIVLITFISPLLKTNSSHGTINKIKQSSQRILKNQHRNWINKPLAEFTKKTYTIAARQNVYSPTKRKSNTSKNLRPLQNLYQQPDSNSPKKKQRKKSQSVHSTEIPLVRKPLLFTTKN